MRTRDSTNHALRERVLDLVWSLWSELGVSGWHRRHQDWGIDPEPLIVFTSQIAGWDPRLRDESIDWCLTYGRYVSRARLRTLLKRVDADALTAFGRYAATVNAHSTLNWPGASEPYEYEPTRNSRMEDFSAPALLALRLRALLGVSARAEVIRVILRARAPLSAAEIAEEVGYTKRSIAEALDSLRLAGAAHGRSSGNQIRFTLNRRELADAVTPLPSYFPHWWSIFRILSALMSVDARDKALSPAARAVEARRIVSEIEPLIVAAGLRRPDLARRGEDFWEAYSEWSEDLLAGLALGEASRAFETNTEPVY